jgi:hypothetical protein
VTPERAAKIAERLAEMARSAPWNAPIGMVSGYIYQRCARCERGKRVTVSSDVISGRASDVDTEQYFANRFAFLSAHLTCPVHVNHLVNPHPVLSVVRSVYAGMDLDHIAEKIGSSQALGFPRSATWSCLGCHASIIVRSTEDAIDATRVFACRSFCEAHMPCSIAAWKNRPN